jgi:hypothetical protein
VTVASRPEKSFWLDSSTSPGNYGWLFLFLSCKTLDEFYYILILSRLNFVFIFLHVLTL